MNPTPHRRFAPGRYFTGLKDGYRLLRQRNGDLLLDGSAEGV